MILEVISNYTLVKVFGMFLCLEPNRNPFITKQCSCEGQKDQAQMIQSYHGHILRPSSTENVYLTQTSDLTG